MRKGKRKRRSLHDRTVDNLVHRLEESGRYDIIDTFVEYKERGFAGEVDVLAYHRPSNTYHFYEVKSHGARYLKKKAKSQYTRYCDCYPYKTVKGILVTPFEVERLRKW